MLKHLFFAMLLVVIGYSPAVSANVAPTVSLVNASYLASDTATWNNGTPWSFTYNGLGQRVSKDTTLSRRYYGYDEQGHLIGEYDKVTGQAIQETVYLGDAPVAVLQGTGVYYVYTDHLSTPHAITNTLNQTIWRWNSDPFGTTLANEDPDGDICQAI